MWTLVAAMVITNVSFNPVFSQNDTIEAKVNQIKNLKVDANQLFKLDNSTEKTLKNGTLMIGQKPINITYEQRGAIPVFENDIILPTEVVDGKAAQDKFIVNSRWSDATVPVVLQPDLPNPQPVLDALRYLMQNTPITFKPVTVVNGIITDPNYVRIVPHPTDCSSPVGMMASDDPLFTKDIKLPDGRIIKGGIYGDYKYHGQIMNIAGWCDAGAISHEFGHALGLWHEQTRCDRDQYVDIVWSNIPKDLQHNFEVLCDTKDPSKAALSPISYGDYDYCSLMHYPRRAVQAIDQNEPIIVPKKVVVGCTDIGTTHVFSQEDKDAISDIYKGLG